MRRICIGLFGSLERRLIGCVGGCMILDFGRAIASRKLLIFSSWCAWVFFVVYFSFFFFRMKMMEEEGEDEEGCF